MNRKRENGQVILIGVIAMLMILLAIFILFDLSTVIRGKTKAQNAVDAAAIVGANWQRHTLNLVGEINLIKACTVLITDEIFEVNRNPEDFMYVDNKNNEPTVDQNERVALLKTASDTLSQMQQRVLFIVPLIGFGAAQQAAKNNGINYNQDYGDAMITQVDMVQGTGNRSALYKPYTAEEFIRKEMFGFNWQPAYSSVLDDIVQRSGDTAKGIAVMPNAQLLGVPKISADPPNGFTSYLQSRRIYEAISTDYWCWLRDLLRLDFSQQKWWGNLFLDETTSFKRESEFLPVNVEIREAKTSTYNLLGSTGILDDALKDSKLKGNKLSDHFDALEPVYDRNGNVVLNTGRDGKLSPLPVLDWGYYNWRWRDYESSYVRLWEGYLRSPFQKQVKYYSGAIARMDMEQRPVTVTGTFGISKEAPEQTLGEGLGNFNSRSARTSLRRMTDAQKRMRSSLQAIRAYTVAKPFGQVKVDGEDKPPHVTEIVLPVFDHTAIIPASLENPGRNPLADYRWYEFLLEYLPVLGTVSSFDDMPMHLQTKFFDFHSLLKNKLNDPGWRQDGINWLETPKWAPDPEETGNTPPTNEDDCTRWDGSDCNNPHPNSLH